MEKCRELDTEGNMMCITKHPGFQSVALCPWNLQAVYYEYRQKYGDLDEPTLHELVYVRQFITGPLALAHSYREQAEWHFVLS